METRRLRSFIEIVNAGSLTRAAANLSIAQPALSQQLADMEHYFGAKLLSRSHTGVKPTSAGLTLYRHSQVILRQLDQAQRDVVTEGKTISGRVKIGILYSTAPTLLLTMVRTVLETYPLIRLHIVEGMSGSLSELTGKHDLDMSILSGDAQTQNLEITQLLAERLYLVSSAAGPAPVEGESVSISDLRHIPLVLPAAGHNLRKLIDDALGPDNDVTNLVAEVDSLNGLATIASAGTACTILPAVALNGSPQMFRLQPITEKVERVISLCVARSLPLLTPAQAVHDLLADLVRKMVMSGDWPGARVLCE